jgi:hypothetical protein
MNTHQHLIQNKVKLSLGTFSEFLLTVPHMHNITYYLLTA